MCLMLHCEKESYFSGDISMALLQGEISSKEDEKLWLEEKNVWIFDKKDNHSPIECDDSLESPHLIGEVEFDKERPPYLLQQ